MPQVSLYIDHSLYKEVQSIAKNRGASLSSFVSDVLKGYIDDSWPEGYFELFGSMSDDPIVEPEDLPASLDSKREPWI